MSIEDISCIEQRPLQNISGHIRFLMLEPRLRTVPGPYSLVEFLAKLAGQQKAEKS